jgi:5-oxoprolinase (ATP-hydrolysing)
LFVVGPESAGAHPGPVCYRKGGYLAVTDANVLLGRIQPHLFPAIFGVGENEELDLQGAMRAFQELTKEINDYTGSAFNEADTTTAPAKKVYTVDEVAYGFIRVANEAMARPIRNLTTMKGFDVTKHFLSTFGGAGPQHCCAIAKSLGMSKVYVHRYSGILSAFGLSLADIVVEKQEPFSGADISSPATLSMALDRLHALQMDAKAELTQQGFSSDRISSVCYLNCRYEGTDTAMMTSIPEPSGPPEYSSTPIKDSSCTGVTPDNITSISQELVSKWLGMATPNDRIAISNMYETTFIENYKREYGFELIGRKVLVDDIRVRAIGKTASPETKNADSTDVKVEAVSAPIPSETVSVYFDGQRVQTPVFLLTALKPGQEVLGPAIIVQNVATVVVDPACRAVITAEGDIEIVIEESEQKVVTGALDPIYLSIFSHRFMGIAEQMGRTLQRTSISVNIKERLDFSCALFDPSGGLVANAPHLPVHLGAMSDAVRYQRKYWGDNILEGDVLVSNHPQLAGGSHLPDITVITPIFIEGKVAFLVASRGHHADVGGIAPGSMPPLSKTLVEEGAAIIAFKLVEHGVFQEEGISDLLNAPGKLAGNFGTRNLSDNISDLKAQVAANRKGAALMHELVAEYGLNVVQAYMVHIQSCAESSVREMLRSFSLQEGMKEKDSVTAEDFLDDGTPIKLTVHIDRAEGSALFDFTGTGPEIYGNLNAPPAVTASAIIYCLRCLLPTTDIPLNQGCLAPIEIRIPKNTILNPSSEAAVVGGNVTTSQRVTDVVLKAFKACAASQGCMNNLTFGDATMGYYETIAGGAGAGPTWHGCSAVHTHMTNTRITDPEILERRYPVILREFAVRKDSGGQGCFRGGDGAVRQMEFTKVITSRTLFFEEICVTATLIEFVDPSTYPAFCTNLRLYFT